MELTAITIAPHYNKFDTPRPRSRRVDRHMSHPNLDQGSWPSRLDLGQGVSNSCTNTYEFLVQESKLNFS